LCGWLNSDFVTYYAQQMNIVRYSQGKQPQIKISDLGTIFIPQNKILQKTISELSIKIFEETSPKAELIDEINSIVNDYYSLTIPEIENIIESIKVF